MAAAGDAMELDGAMPLPQDVGESSLLGRLQAFLPQMAAANAQLDAELAAGAPNLEAPQEAAAAALGQRVELQLGLSVDPPVADSDSDDDEAEGVALRTAPAPARAPLIEELAASDGEEDL